MKTQMAHQPNDVIVELPDWAETALSKIREVVGKNPGESAASAFEFVGLLISMAIGSQDPETGKNVMIGSLVGGNVINLGVQASQVIREGEPVLKAGKDWFMRCLGGVSSVGFKVVVDALGLPEAVAVPLMGAAEVVATRASVDIKALGSRVRIMERQYKEKDSLVANSLKGIDDLQDRLNDIRNQMAVDQNVATVSIVPDEP